MTLDLSPAFPAVRVQAHAQEEHGRHDAAVHKSNRGSLAIKEGNGGARWNGPQFVLVTNGIRVTAFYSLILARDRYLLWGFYVSEAATGRDG